MMLVATILNSQTRTQSITTEVSDMFGGIPIRRDDTSCMHNEEGLCPPAGSRQLYIHVDELVLIVHANNLYASMEVVANNGYVESMPLMLGGSLSVPNVQALAASEALDSEVLDRYIRYNRDVFPVMDNLDVPIVDLNKLLDLQCGREEATKLEFACEEWGFFQLINHGIPYEVLESLKQDIEAFFELSLEERKAFAQLQGSVEGYGQAFVQSEDQKLDWGDMFFLFTQPMKFRNTKFWPNHTPTFSDVLGKYSTELVRITNQLLRMISENLGLAPERLTDIFKECRQATRMNYYPPCPHAIANMALGASPHSDSGGLTILHHISQVYGLQIKYNNGWVPIRPIPGALIINIGDTLEIMSNGKYKSIEHRVIINREKARLSIASFHSPGFNVAIGPLPELVEGRVEKYKTMSHESYVKMGFSIKYDGKTLLDHIKL